MEDLKIIVRYGSLPTYNRKEYIILISLLHKKIYDKRFALLTSLIDEKPFLVINNNNNMGSIT